MSSAATPVGVVGAGTLGTTVVQASLAAGAPVTVLVRPGTVSGRRETVRAALDREVRRGRLDPAAAAQRLRRLHVTADPHGLAGVGVVVECLPEDVDVKRAVLARLESVLAADAVVASSTSSIPAATLARDARRPERVVVAHHIWPAHRLPLVEVAFHAGTSQAAEHRLRALLAEQGKLVVTVADRPGFLVTRALYAYWDAAVTLVAEGVPPAAVDAALERFGWPMGPLRVMDGTTLVSVVRVLRALTPHLDAPLPGLAALAAAVDAGATSFHAVPSGTAPRQSTTVSLGAGRNTVAACTDDEIVRRTVGAMAVEVGDAARAGVAPAALADRAVELAFGFPAGRGGLAAYQPVAVPSLTG